MAVSIPETFRARLASRAADTGGPTGAAWLAQLPALLDAQLQRWELTVDGPAWHGQCAIVVPVRRPSGEPAALKITWPHVEARAEHLALRAWDGHGAVRLLAADPASFSLLLERLDGERDLSRIGILDACDEIGRLFRLLDRPAIAQLDTLAAQLPRWRERLAAPTAALPRRLLQQAASHLTDLEPGIEGASGSRLVHTDLHFANALAPLPGDSDRGPWLAIDPKPLAGEWAYAVAPAIWNRELEAASAHNFAAHVRLRAEIIGEAAGLDPERVRMWTLVRLVINAVDAAAEGASADPFLTRMIALAKAFTSP